jgi:hypothetical protein
VLASAVAGQSNVSGAALNRLLRDGPSLDRTAFFSALDSLAAVTAQDDHQFAAISPPNPAGAVAAQCATTMVDRQRATAQVRTALERLLGGREGRGGGNEAVAAGALGDAGKLLTSADASWASCRRTLHRSAGSARLPASIWVKTPGAWGDQAEGSFVASLLSSSSLAPVHRLSLGALATDPTSVPGASGVSVLPPTTALRIRVVLADPGNVDEMGIAVVVTAVPQGTAPAPAPVRERTQVAADDSVALSLPPLRVGPGRSYVLHITATAEGGASATTSLTVRVSVVPPLPTTTTTTTTTTPATTTSTPVHSG